MTTGSEAEPLSIYIITAEDPLYSAQIFEALFDRFPGSIRGVGFAPGLLTKKRLFMSPLVYGFCRFSFLSLQVLKDMAFGGKIEGQCLTRGVQVDRFESVTDGALLKRLKELNINLLISINCNKKLKKDVIAFPKKGVLNIHNGMLPKYRGLMPIVHSIANREKISGVTVHFIDEKLDNGPILAQATVEILPKDTLFSVWKKSCAVGAKLLPDAVEMVAKGEFKLIENDSSKATYYSFPTFKQLVRYRKEALIRELRLLKPF